MSQKNKTKSSLKGRPEVDDKREGRENAVESSLPNHVEVDDKKDARRHARDRERSGHFAKQVKPQLPSFGLR
jgi:hypothetical protein